MRDSSNKLSPLTVYLHWIIALTMIALVTVGIYMEETETLALYPIHKSVGMLIFVVILVRVGWRVVNGWFQQVGNYSVFEQRLAKLVQWLLIIASVLMPISGMVMSGAGGHGLAIFGVELLAINPDPLNPGQVLALNKTAAGIGHEIHIYTGLSLVVIILLHVCGALKHHCIDHDGTLRRMLGRHI